MARKFRVFNTEAELWAWLSQIARHAFIDYLRRQKRVAQIEIGELPFEWAEPQSQAADKILLEWLEEGLDNLDPEEHWLVEAVYFEARPQKDIAAEQGQTLKSIESKLARIRAKLRKFILIQTRHEG